MTEKTNTFKEMEDKNPGQQQAHTDAGEVSADQFSDVPVGDQVKYTRPDLDGKEDVIDKFQVMSVDTNAPTKSAQGGNCEYWKAQMILTYESKNDDGVQNKEYISGARAFKQKDGTASPISFWYEGAKKQSQSAMIWEMVAKHLDVEPKALSPRQFVTFLNSKPKVKIVSKKYDNYNAPKGAPATVHKNMPGEFLK